MIVKPDPVCPLWTEPIPPGARVAPHQGTLVHVACWLHKPAASQPQRSGTPVLHDQTDLVADRRRVVLEGRAGRAIVHGEAARSRGALTARGAQPYGRCAGPPLLCLLEASVRWRRGCVCRRRLPRALPGPDTHSPCPEEAGGFSGGAGPLLQAPRTRQLDRPPTSPATPLGVNEGTVEAFLQGLLREIDPAAQIVTATREPAGFYAVQVQTLDQAGKLLYLPGGLLTQAQDGNTTALRAIRLLLSSMVREIHSRQVQDRAKRLRYER